ncbi:hypothetical protein [Ornithinimicrobium kibberense]
MRRSSWSRSGRQAASSRLVTRVMSASSNTGLHPASASRPTARS